LLVVAVVAVETTMVAVVVVPEDWFTQHLL
jgi:hypothetical protein